MTHPTITDADRQAAASIYLSGGDTHDADSIMRRERDDTELVQAFARRREAETARIVAWLRNVPKAILADGCGHSDLWDLNGHTADSTIEESRIIVGVLADAIERGEHNKRAIIYITQHWNKP